MSQEAHGKIAKGLIFSVRDSGQMVRQYHKPTGKATAAQLVQRAVIAGLVVSWHALSPAEKQVFNDAAQVLTDAGKGPLTGFNLYVRLGVVVPNNYGLNEYGKAIYGAGSV